MRETPLTFVSLCHSKEKFYVASSMKCFFLNNNIHQFHKLSLLLKYSSLVMALMGDLYAKEALIITAASAIWAATLLCSGV